MPRFQLITSAIAILALGLLSASPAWAGSAIDQYVEAVPSADGKGESTQGDGDPQDGGGASNDATQRGAGGNGQSAGAPSASDIGGLDSDSVEGESSDDGSSPPLTAERVAEATTPGFAGALSSALGPLGLILGGSLLLTLAAVAMIARRGNTG